MKMRPNFSLKCHSREQKLKDKDKKQKKSFWKNAEYPINSQYLIISNAGYSMLYCLNFFQESMALADLEKKTNKPETPLELSVAQVNSRKSQQFLLAGSIIKRKRYVLDKTLHNYRIP